MQHVYVKHNSVGYGCKFLTNKTIYLSIYLDGMLAVEDLDVIVCLN